MAVQCNDHTTGEIDEKMAAVQARRGAVLGMRSGGRYRAVTVRGPSTDAEGAR